MNDTPDQVWPREWLKIGGDLYFGVTLEKLRSADTANLFRRWPDDHRGIAGSGLPLG